MAVTVRSVCPLSPCHTITAVLHPATLLYAFPLVLMYPSPVPQVRQLDSRVMTADQVEASKQVLPSTLFFLAAAAAPVASACVEQLCGAQLCFVVAEGSVGAMAHHIALDLLTGPHSTSFSSLSTLSLLTIVLHLSHLRLAGAPGAQRRGRGAQGPHGGQE